MRRAEADYCERIKQAMTLITGDEVIQPNNETMPADQPAAN
jgi:hypothetical protein